MPWKRDWIRIALMLWLSTRAWAGDIVGTVTDSNTGTPIRYADIVILKTTIGCATDARGNFRITLPAGVYSVQCTHVGYQKKTFENVRIDDSETVRLAIALVPEAIRLSAVVVTPGTFSMNREAAISRRTLSRENIETISPLGDDIGRAVAHLPGVIGSDFSAKFAIRGGEPNETMVMYDGLELIEPFHVRDIGGGALSIIDMEAIGGLELLTGGFTANYGDRLSGIFNIYSIKEAPPLYLSAGVSFLNSRFFGMGQLWGGKGMWMISGRRGTMDLLMQLLHKPEENLPIYYDLQTKLAYPLNAGNELSLQFLTASDNMSFDDTNGDGFKSKYGNHTLWLTLNSFLSPRLQARSLISLAHVQTERYGLLTYESGAKVQNYEQKKATVIGFKQDWQADLSERFYTRWGIELKDLSATYQFDTTFASVPDHYFTLKPHRQDYSAYVSQRVRPLSFLILELGLRYNFYSDIRESRWSPRANLTIPLASKTAIKAGWGIFHQSQQIHELEFMDGKTQFSPPQRSEHYVLGLEQLLPFDIEGRIEAYYKKVRDIPDRYTNMINTLDLFPELSGDRIKETIDRCEAKGIEFFLTYDRGRALSWQVGYSLSQARDWILYNFVPRQFRCVPRLMDQTHTIDINLNYKVGKSWLFNLAWVYHTGWPYTQIFLGSKQDPAYMGTGSPPLIYYLDSKWLRDDRLPAYNRLDFRITRSFETSRGRFGIYLELINCTNSVNIKTYDYEIGPQQDSETAPELKIIRHQWLPFFPSAGIRWEL